MIGWCMVVYTLLPAILLLSSGFHGVIKAHLTWDELYSPEMYN